jgi:hypothetical protein
MRNQAIRIVCFGLTTLLPILLSCTKKTPDFPTIEVYALGVREPKTISIEDANIPDHKTVIGVRVGTKSRAYLVDALKPNGLLYRPDVRTDQSKEYGKHVVNDLVGGRPITVTHCDINGCSRVFVGEGTDALDIAVAGAEDGQMQLSLLREKFPQNSVKAPLADYPFEVATWEEWKSSNPETDIYIGEVPNRGNFEQFNRRPVIMN